MLATMHCDCCHFHAMFSQYWCEFDTWRGVDVENAQIVPTSGLSRRFAPKIRAMKPHPDAIICRHKNVPEPVYWDDAYPIALLLRDTRPDSDPLTVSLDVLRSWVLEIKAFSDDPELYPVECLEEIQREWVELES
jgi:FeS assembly protein IscX